MSHFWSLSETAPSQPCCLLLRAPEKLCSHGSRIRSHLWNIATEHAGKKEEKMKIRELDAQTSLLERGIEFLHNHHFCCPLRMTETEWGQNQEDLWALRGSRRFFGYVSWQNLKSIICLTNTHENNHHSAVTNELLGHSAPHLRLNPVHSFTGWKVPKTNQCLGACRLARERSTACGRGISPRHSGYSARLHGCCDSVESWSDAVHVVL